MKKRLTAYLKGMDAILAAPDDDADWEAVLATHVRQIGFFQHERLIHLLVTLAFGLMTMVTGLVLYLSFSLAVGILLLALLCLLVPYVFHYYTLENGVHRLYAQYDRIRELNMDFPLR